MEEHACDLIKNIFDGPPTLGLDMDGTIDESVEFFSMLSRIWPGKVIIITGRNDRVETINDLREFEIYYDELILVPYLDAKAMVIIDKGVDVYVDDQDECLMDIPDSVTVLKIRNGGNFDKKKWLYSHATGEQI